MLGSANVYIGSNTNTLPESMTTETMVKYKTRVVITNPGSNYCQANKFYCVKSNAHTANVTIEYALNSDHNTWHLWRDTTPLVGWSGPNMMTLPLMAIFGNNPSQVWAIRFTFGYNNVSASYESSAAVVGDFRIFGITAWAEDAMNDKPYKWDAYGNLLPRNGSSNNLGTNGKKWSQIHGVTLYENGTLLSNKYSPIVHTHTNLISLKSDTDERNVDTTPNSYNAVFKISGLKRNDIIGLSGYGTYSGVLGIRPYGDSSGGNSYELAFEGNGSGIFYRTGATTTWGDWNQLSTVSYVDKKDQKAMNILKANKPLSSQITVLTPADIVYPIDKQTASTMIPSAYQALLNEHPIKDWETTQLDLLTQLVSGNYNNVFGNDGTIGVIMGYLNSSGQPTTNPSEIASILVYRYSDTPLQSYFATDYGTTGHVLVPKKDLTFQNEGGRGIFLRALDGTGPSAVETSSINIDDTGIRFSTTRSTGIRTKAIGNETDVRVATVGYVAAQIGNINTILDNINGEVI